MQLLQLSPMYVTIDLDDTLINTQQDYDKAIDKLANWLAGKTTATHKTVTERQNEIDRHNIDRFGLQKERFRASFEQTAQEFLTDFSDNDRFRARALAETAFKSPLEYRERGFRDGADTLLRKINAIEATAHLLTAGDPTIQERKIKGLNLADRIDDISIVGLNEKQDVLERLQRANPEQQIIHIGNSYTSDVTAALNADVHAIYIPNSEWRQSDQDKAEQDDSVTVFQTIPALFPEFERIFAHS